MVGSLVPPCVACCCCCACSTCTHICACTHWLCRNRCPGRLRALSRLRLPLERSLECLVPALRFSIANTRFHTTNLRFYPEHEKDQNGRSPSQKLRSSQKSWIERSSTKDEIAIARSPKEEHAFSDQIVRTMHMFQM